MALAAAAAPPKRKVILVVADGTRAADWKTPGPNLARLMAEGVWFERVFAACPSQGGSRTALLTGRFPHAVRAWEKEKTLPDLLNAAGHSFSLLHWNRETIEMELAAPMDRDAIVVLCSGHGEMRGAHGLEGTDEPYQEAVHVPLLIRDRAALAAGTRSDRLASMVDIMPTVLDLCGVAKPSDLHGSSLAAPLRAESIFAEGKLGEPGEWRMMVRGFDKIVIDRAGEVIHLYNLAEDPEELVNEASARAGRRRKDELTALLELWRRKTGDGRSGSGLKRRGK